MRRLSLPSLMIALAFCASCVLPLHAGSEHSAGKQIYRQRCVKCHGPNGEGVAGKHDDPLIGDRPVASLARVIHRTMPEDEPKKCTEEEAAQVAAFIYDAFYSPQARTKNGQVRVELAHLTVRQYRNAVADLVGSFHEASPLGEQRGLQGEYYKVRDNKDDKKAFERIDPQIEFAFGPGSPDTNQIPAEEFSMHWQGALLAEESGDCEVVLHSPNGVRLWLNEGDAPLIDGWVSSGNEVRELHATTRLLGGRAYPLTLEFFKYKETNAAVTLSWKPPHGALEVIPARSLTPQHVPPTLVVTTAFPPDDSSVGYERGTGVSKGWDEAGTRAAIEVAGYVVEHLDRLAQTQSDAEDRAAKIQIFCQQFVERAFRRSLTADQQDFFVQKHFKNADKIENAVKRVVLLAMKSPRFLYLNLPMGEVDDYDVAARLSFALWDSLPDAELWRAARDGQLRTRDQVKQQATRMLSDARTKSKMRHFFHQWLQMNQVDNLAKDAARFPDFTPTMVADLRLSLDLFLDEVFWSGSADYRQLLLANYLFLNDRLATFYGVEHEPKPEFEKVEFDPEQRAGIVTHPYLLATFSYPHSSSPIHRGVFLTRNIVGRALKPPPKAVEFKESEFDPSLTMREKVAKLTRSEACQTCHSVINPLGFSLEQFDAVGRYRTEENNRPIDVASDYTTDAGETVRLNGARDVAEFAAGSEQAQRAFIEQLFHELVKQPVLAYGLGTMNGLHRSFAQSQFNMRNLLIEIATVTALHGLESSPAATN